MFTQLDVFALLDVLTLLDAFTLSACGDSDAWRLHPQPLPAAAVFCRPRVNTPFAVRPWAAADGAS
ncbi:hypothetical protein ACGFYV_34405 [Streptomyces sp. NPDC048297]|uniref:hypothetical protein n=1 Tax=Streptomyces sp. NPDC048297 TaxID=3365531 RepID=UPI0037231FD0